MTTAVAIIAQISVILIIENQNSTSPNTLVHHLADGAHQEEHDDADQDIHEDDRGAGQRDRFAGAQEQTGADSAADGDELYMAVAEASFHRIGLIKALDGLELAPGLLRVTVRIRIGHTDFISLLCRPALFTPTTALVQCKFKLYHR